MIVCTGRNVTSVSELSLNRRTRTRCSELVKVHVDLQRVIRQVARRLRLVARLEHTEGALAYATFTEAHVDLPIGDHHVAAAIGAPEHCVAYHTAYCCRHTELRRRTARRTVDAHIVVRVGHLTRAGLTRQAATLHSLHRLRREKPTHGTGERLLESLDALHERSTEYCSPARSDPRSPTSRATCLSIQ